MVKNDRSILLGMINLPAKALTYTFVHLQKLLVIVLRVSFFPEFNILLTDKLNVTSLKEIKN